MPYGLDDHGRPIFLISTMAMHTQNLQAAPHASLLVTQHASGAFARRRHSRFGKRQPRTQFACLCVGKAATRAMRLGCVVGESSPRLAVSWRLQAAREL